MQQDAINTILYYSPAGILRLAEYREALCLCDWVDSSRHHCNMRKIANGLSAEFFECATPLLCSAVEQLNEYFSLSRCSFEIPLRFVGTGFQKGVWGGLLHIPFGDAVNYAWLARDVGRRNAVRAVAGAVAANPLSIFVPCHRVVASGGLLGGYAGGVMAKRFLLTLEGNTSVYR